MTVVSIAVNQYTSEATDEKLQAARSRFHELLKREPGFESYTVVKTGDASAVVITTWAPDANFEAMRERIRAAYDDIWGELIAEGGERYRGEIAYSS